ncbi:hypothetical protein [Gordonia aichiensis]|nr:hypothetical protein [Gordonia aichiensis]
MTSDCVGVYAARVRGESSSVVGRGDVARGRRAVTPNQPSLLHPRKLA